MANLYDIHGGILEILENGFDMDCVDQETGEVDFSKAEEKLKALQMNETEKIENTGLFVKNLMSDIEAMKVEEKSLSARRKSKENKLQYVKEYLSDFLLATNKQKFETPRCALSFRKSESLEITDEEALKKYEGINEYLKFKEPEIDKAAIKKAFKGGSEIPGVRMAENLNLQIK